VSNRLLDFLSLPARAQHVLGINGRNRGLIYPHNPRRFYPLADDKILTKEILSEAGVPVPRSLRVITGMEEARRAPQLLAEFDDFVIKPSQGAGGSGILVLLKKTPDGWLDPDDRVQTPWDISRHISNIVFGNYAHGLRDRAIIEERLIQAPLFDEGLFPGLPDIRVITLRGRPLIAMLRVPTRHSHGKANLHQGAVGVGVDLETGTATHASFKGTPVREHPDTGTVLLGAMVAGWPGILDTALRAAAAMPLGYLGVDIALDARRGPVVLEVNVRPGLEIQNANHKGLRGIVAAVEAGGRS
jgi:alpha-L-glutamate ligase-like protein